jgi:hypothetical protein
MNGTKIMIIIHFPIRRQERMVWNKSYEFNKKANFTDIKSYYASLTFASIKDSLACRGAGVTYFEPGLTHS